jgi:hypothetical protein
MTFVYENVEVKSVGNEKTVREVKVKNGKGYKTITKYRNGHRVSQTKKPIKNTHMKMIKGGKFISGLFNDCKSCRRKTKKIYKIH